MAFQSGDRVRIVEQLDLHRDQSKANSILAQLMADLDAFDTTNTTTYANEVRLALSTAETLRTTIAANEASDGIEVLDIDDDYRIEYRPGGATNSDKSKLQANLTRIKNLLDPDGIYLERFVQTGRVIRTL